MAAKTVELQVRLRRQVVEWTVVKIEVECEDPEGADPDLSEITRLALKALEDEAVTVWVTDSPRAAYVDEAWDAGGTFYA